MHYYQFNIGDYASHTAHLDPIEDAAYRRMIDLYYLHESPLPDDIDDIARLIRMRTHCEVIANVLREFFDENDDGWRLPRADKEIEAYRLKSAKAKKSAEARWHRDAKKDDANALQTDSGRNANHKPLTTNHKPKKVGRFAPPTLEEAQGYFVERGEAPMPARSESEKFIDFYASKGWMVGKNKMKDWKAAVRNWMKRNKDETNKRANGGNSRREHSARMGEHLENRIASRMGGEVISPSENDISGEVG